MDTTQVSGSVRAARSVAVALFALTGAYVVLLLASVVVGMARGGDSLLYGDPLRVGLQLAAADLGSVPEGVVPERWLPVFVDLPDPTIGEMLLRAAQDLAPALITLWALWLLVGVLRSAARGRPFDPRSADRFRALGWLLVLGGFLLEVVDVATANALFSRLPSEPSVELAAGPFSLIPLPMLVGGLVAFALAAVFADGSALREDVEATI